MSAIVHVFSFPGLMTAPVVAGNNYATDSIQYLKEPPFGRARLTADAVAVNTDADDAPAGTQVFYVQVEPGKTVYYELTPSNQDSVTAANNTSRYGSGNFTLQGGAGWRISFLEKTGS